MDVLDVIDSAGQDPGVGMPELPPAAPAGLRILAAIGAAGVLLVGAVISFGGVLLAPIAIWIAAHIAKRRGARLTKWPAWVVGAGVICVVALAVSGTVWMNTSGDTVAQLHHNMDSLSAVQRPPPHPAWMDRLSPPGSSQRADQMALHTPPAVMSGMLFIGGILTAEFYSLIVGTLGWGGALLLHYAVRSRWMQ